MTGNLFSGPEPPTPKDDRKVPLAERLRPSTLDEVVGQEHLLGEGCFLREAIRNDEIPSMIFWGPPGVGKTTLARIIASESNAHFASISAVLSGVKEVKKIIEEARYQRRAFSRPTILFVDEIHRFNKAQQDAFLPHVEDGTVVLIGATTENPSFEVISPLLSRTRVLVLEPLTDEQIIQLLERALSDEETGLRGEALELEEGVLERIALFAGGDARAALNALEVTVNLAHQKKHDTKAISIDVLEAALQKRHLLYDKAGDEHYNLISALHKSLRNSDCDAALYWLARMLEAGEDPLYIARRLVRFASEDVGLADPKALGYAMSAMQAYDFIGLPEGKLALAQVTIYLALTAKSNAVYRAYRAAQRDVEETRHEAVPLKIRNAPTRLMKDLDYGKGYRYAHDENAGIAAMNCLPDSLLDRTYYEPGDRGVEKQLKERVRELRQWTKQKKEK